MLGARSWRLRLLGFLVRMWRRWDWVRLNPLAVLRKRFAAARLVFNLGIYFTPIFSLFKVAIDRRKTSDSDFLRRDNDCGVNRFRCSLVIIRRSELFLFRPDQHHHLTTFYHRKLFDLTHLRQIVLNPREKFATDLLMGQFATTKP